MASTDPLIGRQLGDYDIRDMLGAGGMARVYRGYDEQLDRYAAVKVTEPHLIASADEAEYRERFQREARAIARLNHPLIVGVYQFGQIDNLYYIAMEYVQGLNLREVMKELVDKKQLMPQEQVLRTLSDTAQALDYAHDSGIIHRDIKPSNIIIDPDGRAVLTDFGLALNAMEGTIGNTFGSVHYIAPEQAISSKQANPRSDQYSLAVIAYEMLTGQVPFDDASAMSVALKHISDPPPPPRQVNPNIAIEVEEVLMRALDKDFKQRYKTCSEFVEMLDSAFHGLNEDDVPTSSPVANQSLPPARPSEEDNAPTIMDTKSRPIISAEMADLEARSQAIRAATGSQSPHSTIPMPPEQAQPKTESPKRRGWLLGAGLAMLVALVAVGAALFLPGVLNAPDESATQNAVSLAATTTNAAAVLADEQATETQIAALTATHLAMIPTHTPVVTTPSTAHTATVLAVGASAVASATSIATDEPTPTPTLTLTDSPTLIATETPTETIEVSHTPTLARTDTPAPIVTDTSTTMPIDETTPTPSPTTTPTPVITATPGFAMPDEDAAQVLLRYDGRTLVLFNRSEDANALVYDLDFVLLEPDGDGGFVTNNIFEASEWGPLPRGLRPNYCLQVWTIEFRSLPANDPPNDMCLQRTWFRQTSRPFWVDGMFNQGAYFEVRRGDEVLATCDVQRPRSRSEMRCTVDLTH